MTIYLDPLVTTAVDKRDPYLVINGRLNRVVESQPTMKQANDAAEILNKHEQRNGRPCIYKVIKK